MDNVPSFHPNVQKCNQKISYWQRHNKLMTSLVTESISDMDMKVSSNSMMSRQFDFDSLNHALYLLSFLLRTIPKQNFMDTSVTTGLHSEQMGRDVWLYYTESSSPPGGCWQYRLFWLEFWGADMASISIISVFALKTWTIYAANLISVLVQCHTKINHKVHKIKQENSIIFLQRLGHKKVSCSVIYYNWVCLAQSNKSIWNETICHSSWQSMISLPTGTGGVWMTYVLLLYSTDPHQRKESRKIWIEITLLTMTLYCTDILSLILCGITELSFSPCQRIY